MRNIKSRTLCLLPLLVTIIFIFSAQASAEPVIPGDINLNGTPFELDDVAIFADYFALGLAVFNIDLEAQIAATDANMDGMALSVADFIFMLKILSGDSDPQVPPADTISVGFREYQYESSLRLGLALEADQGDRMVLHYYMIEASLNEVTVYPGYDEISIQYDYSGANLILIVSGLHSIQSDDSRTNFLEISYDGPSPILNQICGTGLNGEHLDMQVSEGEFHVGDVNMNSYPFEIADVVLFTNALIYGEERFGIDPEIQMAATDANGDGIPFTVEDYEFFIGVIIGRINPDDPIGPTFQEQLIVSQSDESISIYSTAENEVGAIYLTYLAPNLTDYQVTLSEDLAGMIAAYDLLDDTLRILIYDFDNEYIGTSATDVVDITYTGDPPILVSASSAGFEAEKVNLSIISRGDVNGDGQINVGDVVAIIRIVFGWDVPEPWQLVAMDTNCDGSLDIGEAVYLINYIFKGGPGPYCP